MLNRSNQIVRLGYTIVAMALLSVSMYLLFRSASSECKPFQFSRDFKEGVSNKCGMWDSLEERGYAGTHTNYSDVFCCSLVVCLEMEEDEITGFPSIVFSVLAIAVVSATVADLLGMI